MEGIGILNQINNSKPFGYLKLSKEQLIQLLKTPSKLNNYNNIKSLIMSELSSIMFNLSLNPKHKYYKEIQSLYRKINLYKKLIDLRLLKLHHINIGISEISYLDNKNRIEEFGVLKNKCENKIKELYYVETTI